MWFLQYEGVGKGFGDGIFEDRERGGGREGGREGEGEGEREREKGKGKGKGDNVWDKDLRSEQYPG